MLIPVASVLLECISMSDRLFLRLYLEHVFIVTLGFIFLRFVCQATASSYCILLLECPRLENLSVHIL